MEAEQTLRKCPERVQENPMLNWFTFIYSKSDSSFFFLPFQAHLSPLNSSVHIDFHTKHFCTPNQTRCRLERFAKELLRSVAHQSHPARYPRRTYGYSPAFYSISLLVYTCIHSDSQFNGSGWHGPLGRLLSFTNRTLFHFVFSDSE